MTLDGRPIAEVFTDGSCVDVVPAPHPNRVSGPRGYGGWCAVVEDGHEGWVLRGAEENTTATRMELVGVLEGLRSLDDGRHVRLWFDCTVVLSIKDRLDRAIPHDWRTARDGDLWVQVAHELVRLRVELRLIEKRERVPQHQRAHTFAGGEARRLREEVRSALAPRVPRWALHKSA
jgi:ribonuclease HI